MTKPTRAGDIKVTTNYVLLVVYRRMNFPRIVRRWARRPGAEEKARQWAEERGIILV